MNTTEALNVPNVEAITTKATQPPVKTAKGKGGGQVKVLGKLQQLAEKDAAFLIGVKVAGLATKRELIIKRAVQFTIQEMAIYLTGLKLVLSSNIPKDLLLDKEGKLLTSADQQKRRTSYARVEASQFAVPNKLAIEAPEVFAKIAEKEQGIHKFLSQVRKEMQKLHPRDGSKTRKEIVKTLSDTQLGDFVSRIPGMTKQQLITVYAHVDTELAKRDAQDQANETAKSTAVKQDRNEHSAMIQTMQANG